MVLVSQNAQFPLYLALNTPITLSNQTDNTNFNFETYAKKAESEFTAFQPVTISQVYQLLTGLSSNRPRELTKFLLKLLR